jgi:nucleotide-binding universal stress UspA family protein
MIKIDRVLVPTDFSEYSDQARTYACELAKRFDAELHLVHVVHLVAQPFYGGPISDELLNPEEPALEKLEGLQGPDLDQVSRVVRRVQVGSPFVEIVRYARENDVDLIVMGTHGRTGLAHALIGSVAERVVRKAPCPVLTVRPEGHQFVMP